MDGLEPGLPSPDANGTFAPGHSRVLSSYAMDRTLAALAAQRKRHTLFRIPFLLVRSQYFAPLVQILCM